MGTFEQVKDMAMALGLAPENEDPAEELFTVTDEERGINYLVIDCEEPILVLEQVVAPVGANTDFQKLLKMNRHMIHGAFVLSDNGTMIIWRDTLQLANLDLNELEGSLNALSLTLAENADDLVEMSK